MLELLLCSMLTILPDYLFRRFVQDKRIGREITLFSVWYELRWGITLCLILTVSLITTVFYFHPATMAANSVFRTITVMPQDIGRVAETYVEMYQRVQEGDPLFRLDSSAQEASLRTAEASLRQLQAAEARARAQLAAAEAQIGQARAAREQAFDEFATREELFRRNPDAIPERQVEIARVAVEAADAAVAAAIAQRDAVQSQLEIELPAQVETAQTQVEQAKVALDRTLVVAGTDGVVQQFVLRPGDIVNPMLRPAGILVPDARVTGLLAGFGQIEAAVIKPGMIGEVACIAKPWEIVPVVVTEIQDVIATGQVRATDQLLGVDQIGRPGTITAVLEPLFEGELDDLPRGSNCIANLYTSMHEALQDPEVGGLHALALHGIDAVGLVHAMLLRIQAALLPFRTLVFSGGH
jgi:multidrug resistance efflux pump